MGGFDEREKSEEGKFVVHEELRFKAEARRNKLLGLWAAEMLGLSGEKANAYATEVIKADLEKAGDENVFRKIRKDFDASNVKQSDHQIRRTMGEMMDKAIDQIENGA